MKRFLSPLVSLCMLCVLITPPVYATNGYFLIGYGQKSRGMGGVGVAKPQGFMAAAANPAAIGSVGSGIEIGAELFNPPRKASAGAADPNFPTEFEFEANAKSGSNLFLIPSFGAVYKFNRRISMGMTAIGNGSNTRYSDRENFFSLTGIPPGEISWGTLGVNLIQMQMLFPISYRVNKNHTLGVAPVAAVQTFRAYGLGNFGGIFQFSTDIENMTNRGNDWSYGAGIRLGWLGTFFDKRLSLGVNYASRTYMTKFDKYKGLFAEQGGFDIPEHYAIGVSVKATRKLTIASDIQWIKYGDIRSIANTHPTSSLNDLCTRPIDAPPSQCSTGIDPVPSTKALGATDGFGFGWDDALVYKFGMEYAYNAKLDLRMGWNYGESVVRDDQLLFNLIAPAVVEHHLTLGFSYRPSPKIEWSADLVRGFKNRQKCAVNDGCKTMLTQNPGTYAATSLELWTLGGSFSYRF